MRIIFLGCPGAGKGTQAEAVANRYNIPMISTGNMLRVAVTAQSMLGLAAKKIMDRGELVPDGIIINLVKERISEPDCKKGYLLDGFPRTIPQAEALYAEHIQIDFVLEIYVPEEEILRRLGGRRVHAASGRVYHEEFNPPRIAGKDDVTGEHLVHRDDDKRDTILERLRIYHDKTEPLIGFYKNLSAHAKDESVGEVITCYARIDGTGEVADVEARIINFLEAHKPSKKVL